MKTIQILYPTDSTTSNIHSAFREEADAFRQKGFLVGCQLLEKADTIIKRGFSMKRVEQYPSDKRFIQGWREYTRTRDFTLYAEYIRPSAIPFVILDKISIENIEEIMYVNKWPKLFIKTKNTSLFMINDDASVYPTSTLSSIIDNYAKIGECGPFIVREFIDDIEIFYNEQRYWILNGSAYHPSGIIPDFVKDVGKKIFESSNSKYFVIDVAGEYIVEVNAGESSDRGGDNPLDFFSDIFAKEFL